MIEHDVDTAMGGASRLVLRPNRSATVRQLTVFFALQAFAAALVAGVAWSQGNVFAPPFAVLHAAFIALALRFAWRRGDRYEEVAITDDAIEGRRWDHPEALFRAHPYWVRLRVGERRGELCLTLGASGREVEVGALLAPEERRRLAERLRGMLAKAGSVSEAR